MSAQHQRPRHSRRSRFVQERPGAQALVGRGNGASRTNAASEPVEDLSFFMRIVGLIRAHPVVTIGMIVSSLLAGICESAILGLLAQIAVALVNGTQTVSISIASIHIHSKIANLLYIGLALAVLRLLLQGPLSYLPPRLSADQQAQTRCAMFQAFVNSSWDVQSRDSDGKFQEVITNQVNQAVQSTLQIMTILNASVMLIVLIASALLIGLVPALSVLVAAALLFLLLRPFNRIGRNHAKELSAAQVAFASGTYDAVALAEEAHVFGVGEAQLRQLSRLIEDARNKFFSTQLLSRLVPGVYQGMVFLLLLGGLAILNATGSGHHAASLGAVILLLVRASSFGQQVQSANHLLHQSLPFVNRVEEAETRYKRSVLVAGDGQLSSGASLTFRDVSYAYVSGADVLEKINFSIEAGESIGIVGPSGAGKSTLVQLLLRLRFPESGVYLINGMPADYWSFPSWTRSVAYVPQEPRLVHHTVAKNIAFYRDLDRSQIEDAGRRAHIHHEIQGWTDGYDTLIGQRANAISGGERQRLCLARALAGNPDVLILDEPTSSLDPRSESLVQDSLRDLRGSLTLIIVAHRFSTLSICDKVMVVKDGVIDAFGPIDELVETNEYYRNAAKLWQSGSRS